MSRVWESRPGGKNVAGLKKILTQEIQNIATE